MLPKSGWLRGHRSRFLRRDLAAGISLAACVIPEKVSHAHLVGLWPRVGLYSAIAAALAYAVFGRARFLIAATNPSLAILMAGDIGSMAVRDPPLAAAMAALTALIAGVIAVSAWALRLGFLSNLISKSALIGFTVGAGLLVIGRQLPPLCGLEVPSGSPLVQLADLLHHPSEVSWSSLAVGAGSLALLALGDRLLPGRPVPLVVLCLSLVLSRLMDLSRFGVELVGPSPSRGAWASSLGAALASWRELLPLGLSVFLLSYVQDISAAREVAPKQRERVSPNRELLANGATNLSAGLVGGMPSAASLVSSSSSEVAATTPLALVVSGAIMLLVAFIPEPLRYLPVATLSANLIRHASKVIDPRAFLRLYRLSKREFAAALATLLGVLVLGPLWGVLIGVVVTTLGTLPQGRRRSPLEP